MLVNGFDLPATRHDAQGGADAVAAFLRADDVMQIHGVSGSAANSTSSARTHDSGIGCVSLAQQQQQQLALPARRSRSLLHHGGAHASTRVGSLDEGTASNIAVSSSRPRSRIRAKKMSLPDGGASEVGGRCGPAWKSVPIRTMTLDGLAVGLA